MHTIKVVQHDNTTIQFQCYVLGDKAIVAETVVMRCHGMRMYSRYADDFHRPIVWIIDSLTQALAAVVAAPIVKLWPLVNASQV